MKELERQIEESFAGSGALIETNPQFDDAILGLGAFKDLKDKVKNATKKEHLDKIKDKVANKTKEVVKDKVKDFANSEQGQKLKD